MNKPIGVGIIGCGNVVEAYQYHLQILKGQGLVDVIGVCDIDIEKARRYARKHHIALCTDRLEKILESPEIDLVLVITSMKAHAEIACKALLAGKHVLLEKPMGTTLEEAEKLLEVCEKTDRYLVCAPFVMLSPTYQKIAQRINRGDIGSVLTCRARYGHSGPTWGPWYYRQGGGVLFDLAPYNLTSLTGWLGPVQRVTAFAGTAIPKRLVEGQEINVDVEDNAHILLDFGESVYAVVTAGFTIQQYRCPAIELYGSSGTLQMMGDDWDPEGYELFQNSIGAWQIYKETDPGWLWTDGLRHVVDCIQKKIDPIIAPAHAFHVLEIMIRARESAQDAQVKPIKSKMSRYSFENVLLEGEAIHLMHDRTHQRE